MIDAATVLLHAGPPDHVLLELLGGVAGGLATALVLFYAVKRFAARSSDPADPRRGSGFQ